MRVMLTRAPAGHSVYAELVNSPPDAVSYTWPETPPPAGAGAMATPPASHAYARRLLALLRLPHLQPLAGRGESSDLVHSCQGLLLTSRPWVVDIEHASPFVGTSFDRWHSPIARGVIRRVLRGPACRAILPWTDTAAEGFLRWCGDDEAIRRRVTVVPPAIAVGEPPPPRPGPVAHLLFVANRPEWNFVVKGGRELLAAVAQLRTRHPHLRLSIVGPRPADEPASMPGVTWHGLVDRSALAALYRAADAYVMPSFSDTFGMVYLEAMAAALPIVALDRPYTRDIVRDEETGLLVPMSAQSIAFCGADGRFAMTSEAFIARRLAAPADPAVVSALVDRVERLIGNPALARALGARGRDEVTAGRFSIPRRNAALSNVYADAIASG